MEKNFWVRAGALRRSGPLCKQTAADAVSGSARVSGEKQAPPAPPQRGPRACMPPGLIAAAAAAADRGAARGARGHCLDLGAPNRRDCCAALAAPCCRPPCGGPMR
jgi:hypothetical protein